jgi:hypothetical protein
MKRAPDFNILCLSCRRQCKQQALVVVAACPRYYPGPVMTKQNWKQQDLLFSRSD